MAHGKNFAYTAYLQQNFGPHCCLLACSPSVIGAHIEVSTQHTRHAREIKIVWRCLSNVNASDVLFLQFSEKTGFVPRIHNI